MQLYRVIQTVTTTYEVYVTAEDQDQAEEFTDRHLETADLPHYEYDHESTTHATPIMACGDHEWVFEASGPMPADA